MHIPTKSKRDDMLWLLLEQCWAFEPEHRPNAEQVRDEVGISSKATGTNTDGSYVVKI